MTGRDEQMTTQQSEEERISQQYRTVQQIANSYPVGEKRLYKAIKDGELPRVKIGTRLLLREAVVIAWLRAQETPATMGPLASQK